jgi:exoribonuclease-2
MRPRTISTKPAVHWGLGLDQYTQVTSPLRRYTDLLCHQQIRAFIKGGTLLSEDEVLFRVSAAEAAALTAARAERASRSHWTAVYLSDKKGSAWEGVVLDLKGNRGVVLIPALGLETKVNIRGNLEPNDPVALVLRSVNISEGAAVFAED